MKVEIPLTVKLRGFYRIKLRDREGNISKDTGWFENLITNQGLDQWGNCLDYYNATELCTVGRCGVGTSNTPPTVADTVLNAPLAMTPAATGIGYRNTNFTTSYVAGPPAYWSAVSTYIFTLGTVVGNIAEVGVGIVKLTTDTTPYLTSHALIVDGGGTPTTISVTAADQLEVTFELRHYLDLTDTAYSITISGTGYSGVIRRAMVNTTTLLRIVDQVDRINSVQPYSITCTVYNGTIGAVTSFPSGSSADLGTATVPAYVNGNYYQSYTWSADTVTGNLSGGITAIAIGSNIGTWQLSVSPAIAKDNTKTMTLQFNVSWARYP